MSTALAPGQSPAFGSPPDNPTERYLKMAKDVQDNQTEQRNKIVSLTPFQLTDLDGQKFARGSMLGGAVPVQEAEHEAPWKEDLGSE